MYRATLISMKDTRSLNRPNNPKWRGQLDSKHKRWGVPKAPNLNRKSTSLTVNSPKTNRLNPTVSGLPQLFVTMLDIKMRRPRSTMLGHKHARRSKKFLPRNVRKSHGVQVHWQRMSETTQLVSQHIQVTKDLRNAWEELKSSHEGEVRSQGNG